MSGLLESEILQGKPFKNLGEELFLNLWRTALVLSRAEVALLKTEDLSEAQYNVLRILRGAGETGLSCGQIAERMVNRDPDVTRLLDRLQERGLVSRQRAKEDRRVVVGSITPAALEVLARLDGPLVDIHRRQAEPLSEEEVLTLIDLLERLRRAA